MRPRLYVVPASHPCAAVEAALRMKGVEYDVTELPPGPHALHQRLRFGRRTVPALRAGDESVAGSGEILRWLERRRPGPPLWPAEPEARAAVERAEAWGEEVLQALVRRLVWWSLRRRPDAMPSFLAQSRLPVPAWAARLSGPVTAFVEWRLNGVGEERAREDAQALPGHLALIDRWLEQGVLGGESPNAADLQIASSLAIGRTVGDLTALIDAHPAGGLARRWFADYPGSIPEGTLPTGSAPPA